MADMDRPKINRWPFLFADLLFLGVGGYVCYSSERPLELWQSCVIFASVAAGAWCSFTPFKRQFEADVKLAESDQLTNAVAQIQNLEAIANQIQQATGQWQNVQEHAAKTSNSAKEVADRMTAEIRSFSGFLEKANQTERQHLRLEIDKLKRSEGEWLQINVRILDHVFALYAAAVRSGQPALIEQIGQFQDVCVDALRRVGLNPFAPRPDEPYNPETHNLPPNIPQPPAGTPLGATIAPGFTFQGQLLRKPLVAPKSPPPPAAPEPVTSAPAIPEPSDAPTVSNAPVAVSETQSAPEAATAPTALPQESQEESGAQKKISETDSLGSNPVETGAEAPKSDPAGARAKPGSKPPTTEGLVEQELF